LERLLRGENVVVSTGTASWKSLIFQLYSLHLLKSSSSKVLVFYPLKALSSDRHARWVAMASMFGVPAHQVVRIDGDTKPDEREKDLEAGRIVLMTPDICQAWLMRNIGSSLARRFLDGVRLLVLDEAHVYESVFGSNVAFLLRRLFASRLRASPSKSRRLQVIAATATILEPVAHLHRLTGLQFSDVGEAEDGAPRQPRKIVHVNGAPYGTAGEAALADLARGVLALRDRHRFIAFLDSRQGVERSVRQIAADGVLPYRSGYEAEDRKRIETALRNGELDGVVSTSALELGIDVADMEVGINLGVPQSKKAFRQRIGRVGRATPGLFFVIAPPNAFRQFGQTFREYYESSVEPSYLYLGNRFIQFAHARCLLDEMEVLGGDRAAPPAGAEWPDGFAETLAFARPGGGRPREFDVIAQLGADAPHLNYPLRQVGEANFQIKDNAAGAYDRVGNISSNQAIREAYPGALYLHFGRGYKVHEWSTRAFDRSIRVSPAKSAAMTRPILRKTVTLSLGLDGVVDGRIKRSQAGLAAEVHLQVNESVEGFRIGSKPFLYKDLRAENPNMSRKQRDLRTTGVVVKVEQPWFSGGEGDAARRRERTAEALLNLLSRDRSISPQDVDATHTNIAVLTESGPQRLTDAVVIYDSVYGGLRLTESLFDQFQDYIAQLDRAANLSGGDALVSGEATKKLVEWAANLQEGGPSAGVAISVPDGWYQVYRPGSVVSVYSNGNLVEREIVEPKLLDPFGLGTKTLYYSYKSGKTSGFVPHDQVQATGQDWSWVMWHPDDGIYQDLEDAASGIA